MNAGIWSESDQLETTWCSHEGTFSFWHCFYSPQCSEATVSHFRLLAHISFSAGIYTFSDSTSPWGKTGHKRNQKGDSLCVLKNPRRFSCFLPIRLTPSCLFWLLTSVIESDCQPSECKQNCKVTNCVAAHLKKKKKKKKLYISWYLDRFRLCLIK